MSLAKITILFAVLLATLFSQRTISDPAKPCNPHKCKFFDCFVPWRKKNPGNLSASSIPHIVMITFDLADVSSNGFSLSEEIFNGQFKNPNDCNISAAFFVSHEYTGYFMVQAQYNKRNEISDNSIARRLPISW